MGVLKHRAFPWALAAGLFLLDIGLGGLFGRLYGGTYDNWAASALLFFAMFLSLGCREGADSRLSPKTCLAVAAGAAVLAVSLFVLFRPACTPDSACALLEKDGWREVHPNEAYSVMTITGNQNPFIRAGYVLEVSRDGETRRVFLNPENGEHYILND